MKGLARGQACLGLVLASGGDWARGFGRGVFDENRAGESLDLWGQSGRFDAKLKIGAERAPVFCR